MEWTDQGIILSARRHGETSAVLSVLTREHGRHAGLVRGGTGKSARGSLQPGNRIQLTWKARLTDHLGQITWEQAEASGTRWLDDPARLAVVTTACALSDAVFPERDPHPQAFNGLLALLSSLGDEHFASLYVHWEIGLLGELGFGLDFSQCAAGGQGELAYVSPRTGRAVSAEAGEPYKDRLLVLPGFLLTREAGSPEEIRTALEMTGSFLERLVLAPQGKRLPEGRGRLFP
jgi:DNA repair protein RecO (recombination protein O)